VKTLLWAVLSPLLFAGLCNGSESSVPRENLHDQTRSASQALGSVNVTQHHNNPSRDGLFIDPGFTPSAAMNLARDVNFSGTIVGNVYAAPLYVEGGSDNRAKVIVVTMSNNVYALDAVTGAIIWQRNVGTPAGSMGLFAGVGIAGTPVIDLASRALFLVAVISGPNNMVYSLNVDTGAINAGFPIDVNAAFSDFSSSLEMQRAALAILGNRLYIPYGGYADIGNYHGRVLGVSLDGSQLGSWATSSLKSGIWSPGGIASDGTNLFVATGNAPGGTTPWGGSEAVIRLQPGPIFSGATADFWAPTTWQSLDTSDNDLGGTNAIVVDVPGATPSALIVALGKDRNAYLLNRNNLGGIVAPVGQGVVSTGQIINAPVTYRTSLGTFVALRPVSGTLTAFKITASSPPAVATGWSVTSTGRTSPFVTSPDGTTSPIVWAYGHGTNQRLFGYNGETGAVVYSGGGANDTISGTRTFNTGIAARGRIYIAGDNRVYAFKLPFAAFTLSSAVSRKTHGVVGDFDVALPGIECRGSDVTNDYTLVFTFSNNLASGSASVTSGTGTLAGTPAISGNTMTVHLTGVANAQTIGVTLSSLTDQFLQTLPDTAVHMSVLIGDVNGNGMVNATDVGAEKAQSGVPVSSANFRSDLNANGAITASDVAILKSHSGESLP
jgi:outer membrane protein assembly factor BamB